MIKTHTNMFLRLATIMTAIATLVSGVALVKVTAQATDPLNAQIEQDKHKLEGVDGEITSIHEQITKVQTNLAAAAAKQAEAERQIATTAAESQSLVPELTNQAEQYNRQKEVLGRAISIDYKTRQNGAIELMAESATVSETLDKVAYQGSISNHLQQLANTTQETFDSLRTKKSQLDLKRSTLEVLRRQLNALKDSQNQQRHELNELLANRSNEATYLADRIAKAKAAQEAILKGAADGALWGTYADGAAVKQGDIIGFEGSTGNSTGCHTHFSTILHGQWVDPQPYVSAGALRQPDGSITQPYGMTSYAKSGAYGGGIHNGIDFVQPCGSPVRAAKDGVVIRDNRTDGSGFGHYLMLRHSDGLITLYGHLL